MAAPRTQGAGLKDPRREDQSWAVDAGLTPYLGVNAAFREEDLFWDWA